MVNHHDLKPTIRIGKNGITDQIIADIKRQIRQRKIIKIKFLKTFLDTVNKNEIFEDILEKTNSILVHKIGGVLVLARK